MTIDVLTGENVAHTKRNARIAGALYVLMGVTAPFSLIYVPRTLIVSRNATVTARNILAHEMMFRTAIVSELFIAVLSIFVVLALYRLLAGVNKTQATLMVILGALISAPISFLNVLNEIAALILLRGPDYLSVFNRQQLEALALFFLRLHSHGVVLAEVFWGLWLLPFGLLVVRSGFIPKILGVLLILNCFPYLLASVTYLLIPGRGFTALSPFALVLETGELWMMLWLLIKGVKEPPIPMSPGPAMAAAS